MVDYNRLRPAHEIYDATGQRLGLVGSVSGDRFQLNTRKASVWVPYEWLTAVYDRAAAVSFRPSQLGMFERAGASRWLRWGA